MTPAQLVRLVLKVRKATPGFRVLLVRKATQATQGPQAPKDHKALRGHKA